MVPQRAGSAARADIIFAAAGAPPDVTMLDTARAAALGRPFGAARARRNLPADPGASHDARIRQHPQPGRRRVSASLADQRRQSRHRAASRLARRGAAAQGRRRHGGRAVCARWSAPPRSISASTGATSISSSMSVRRKAPRAFCSALAAPITAWTSPRKACWCRPIASRCWNAAPRSTRLPRTRRTPRRCAPARSTFWRSMCSAALRRAVSADELYAEVTTAAPYSGLTRADFDAVVDFVATGGYALKAYDASPASARTKTAAGASPTRAWRNAIASMSAPSSKPTC